MTEPVGIIHSCFTGKFGIPRQPGLIRSAQGRIELYPPWNREEAVRGLEAFSHIWVSFLFHAVPEDEELRLTVRPPRLGGNERLGVFATRSPFRPNRLGLSVVALDGIEIDAQGVSLRVSGLDILDQTPVLDIKPYVPYSDSLPDARAGFAAQPPERTCTVEFSCDAENALQAYQARWPHLRELITDVLALDPRPAYRQGSEDRQYGMRLHDVDVRWSVSEQHVTVEAIVGV